MAKRIDYPGIVGHIYFSPDWGAYAVQQHYGKDDKNKHWYEISFRNSGNSYKCHYKEIVDQKAIDLKVRKANKARTEAIRIKQRNRLIKQSKAEYRLDKINEKVVLGVDLASYKTGICYAVKGEIKKAGVIEAKEDDYRVRGHKIVSELIRIIKKGKIELVVLESVYLGLNSTILEKLAELRGMLTYHLQELKVDLVTIPPNLWKNSFNLPTTRVEQKKAAMELYKQYTGKDAETDDEADAYLMTKFCLEHGGVE